MHVQTLEQENQHGVEQAQGKVTECQAQVVNLRAIVAELRSEAAADMVSLSNPCLYREACVWQLSWCFLDATGGDQPVAAKCNVYISINNTYTIYDIEW